MTLEKRSRIQAMLSTHPRLLPAPTFDHLRRSSFRGSDRLVSGSGIRGRVGQILSLEKKLRELSDELSNVNMYSGVVGMQVAIDDDSESAPQVFFLFFRCQFSSELT